MLITVSDVEKEISHNELVELTDLNNTNSFNETVFDDAVSEAISYIGTIVNIPSQNMPYGIKKILVDETIYNLRKKNSLLNKDLISYRESAMNKLKSEAQTDEKYVVNSSFSFKHNKKYTKQSRYS